VEYQISSAIEGLNGQLLILLSLALVFLSINFLYLGSKRKGPQYKAFACTLMLASTFLFFDETSPDCGCDYSEDGNGCDSACAYDWNDQFFTTKYIKAVTAHYL
jgi:hypothetical protein